MNDTQVTTLPAPFNKVSVPDGMVWRYDATIRDGRVEHIWLLKNERGAIHIFARLIDYAGRSEWIGGIECHYASAPDYMDGDKPSHEHCWALHKPCWHDGTSLGFSENVAPSLPHPYEPWKAHDMQPYHHGVVTSVLLRWHRNNFPTDEA